MREYLVVYSRRNAEYSVICKDQDETIWHEHSGPYMDQTTPKEVAEALRIKAERDAS